MTLGVGMFIGSWVSGRVVDAFARRRAATTGIASGSFRRRAPALVLVLFALFFRSNDVSQAPQAGVAQSPL